METHSMKLSTHCCANLKATQSFEVLSSLLCRQLATSAHCALSFYVAYHFMAELQLFLVASTLL
ncbi:unnamed protein product [Staurois parvus]|uniref:Uncharacterized protein n=1 Tax=Staurois parvus TaxID=386267 RepID=A0ABN9GSE5_9NEOB|nr:unnamed protein product [Staurois parvus]